MEREQDEDEDAVHEVTLQEALTNQTKVVKLVVDKWFVDKGFGFDKAPTDEIVFIHASVVQGAEVLMIGTNAWAQVVSDDARAQGEVPSKKSLGTKRVEGEQGGTAGKASSGTDCRAGSSVREEDRRGVRPANGGRWLTPPGHNDARPVGHIQMSLSKPGSLQLLRKVPWKTKAVCHASSSGERERPLE